MHTQTDSHTGRDKPTQTNRCPDKQVSLREEMTKQAKTSARHECSHLPKTIAAYYGSAKYVRYCYFLEIFDTNHLNL